MITSMLNQNEYKILQVCQRDQLCSPGFALATWRPLANLPMPGSGKGLRRFVEEIGHGVSASGPMGAFEIGY